MNKNIHTKMTADVNANGWSMRVDLPSRSNEVWSMDFVTNVLTNGRQINILTIVDDFTKEAIDLFAEHGISEHYVVLVLQRATQSRGLPAAIRTDQCPVFTGKALRQWAYQNGVQLKRIESGKPTQKALIETFNGPFRDECLNDHRSKSLDEARIRIAAWRRDYNEHRPHSALNYQTPAEFAAGHQQKEATKDAGKMIKRVHECGK